MSIDDNGSALRRRTRGVWIKASILITPDGLSLNLENERGGICLADGERGSALVAWQLSASSFELVRVPADWQEFFKAAVDRHRASSLAPHLAEDTIPVFLHPPLGMGALDWEHGLELLALSPVQPVRAARLEAGSRPPFNLPIDVLALEEVRQELAALEGSSWYTSVAEVKERGLVIETTDLSALQRALHERTHDVVIARENHWSEVFDAVRSVVVAHGSGAKEPVTRPRLIVLLGITPATHLHSQPYEYLLPAGTALLVGQVPGASASAFLKDLFYGIFHDKPLHGALQEALKKSAGLLRARLFADPRTNHGIRISDALLRLQKLTDGLRYDASAGDVGAFIGRHRRDTDAWKRIEAALAGVAKDSSQVDTVVQDAQRLAVDFSRESRGLVPLSQTFVQLDRALGAAESVKKELAQLMRDEQAASELEKVQQRHVDVGLELRDPAINTFVRIESDQALLANAEYRVRAHIGHRAADSLVMGDPPPLDPLLPDLDKGESGYELDVAVFEKDFELLSPRVMRLHLPLLGGSQPIYFNVRTPREPGAAQLRLNVYYRNNLLQAFLLKARVSVEPQWYNERVVTVELDVATTAAFGNLKRRGPRTLAIGVNANADGATHTIMLKKDWHSSHALKLTETLAGDQIEKFRALLKQHTQDDKQNQYFESWPAPGAKPVPQFEAAIRALAQFGHDLYLGVFQSLAQEMQAELTELRGQSDATIQIVRHRGDAVFPWAVIYDYFAPSDSFRNTAPVCLGEPLPDAPSAVQDGLQSLRGCPHNPGREVYCVHGFWGLRHRLEQLTRGGGAADLPESVAMLAAANTVCLAAGVEQLEITNLSTTLQTTFGKKFLHFPPPPPPGAAFGPFMWNAGTRPAVLILLSHLGNPGSGQAYISLAPEGGAAPLTLTANHISQLTLANSVWKEQPRTLVLLMACESGATKVGTLNDFVMAFAAAGAAAIVGTEVPVYASLATRFAHELIASMRTPDARGNPMTLGGAVRGVTAKLMEEGNPLGLVFNYCGNADLILA